jgi:hypothetical protein
MDPPDAGAAAVGTIFDHLLPGFYLGTAVYSAFTTFRGFFFFKKKYKRAYFWKKKKLNDHINIIF